MLKETIQQDAKKAMMEKKDKELSVLRVLLAAIQNREKDKLYRQNKEGGEAKAASLTDSEVIDAIASEVKKLNDALVLFEKGGRADLVEKTKEEIEILKKYLPAQMAPEAVKVLVKDAIAKTGAASVKDMGKVMAALMPQVKGKADAGMVSKMVKDELGAK